MSNTKNKAITATLRTKNGRYYAVFYCRGMSDKQIWRSLNLEDKPGNKRKAQDKMEEMKYQYRGVIDVPGYDISFVDYMRQYKERKAGEIEENTLEALKRSVDNKIIAYFEPMRLRLSEVKPQHIHHFYEYLYKKGRADGSGGLSIPSIKSIKYILSDAFKRAILDEMIVSNPIEAVKLPAKENPRKHHVVLNKESADRLLGYIIDDELMYPLLLTTLRYGLRRSEVIGLKWSAVDFRNRKIRIESVITNEKNPEKQRTKTKTSNASFDLFPDVAAALLIRKKAQDRQREILGDAYVKTDYVFTYENGKFLKPDWVTARFKTILAEAGFPYMRFHDLRHSTACIMYSLGMGIKELQHFMRHGKIEMTADTYLHCSEEQSHKLANKVQNMLACVNEDDDMYANDNTNLA